MFCLVRHGLAANVSQLVKKQRPAFVGEPARHVSWGFKAPVSMMLVPFFEEAWGKAKFLHVVRDGRDIAFSGNQTPVEKYYAETFPGGSGVEAGLKEPALKAIALWDSWNVGVYEWAAAHKEEWGGAGGMDYLLLHVEDLIDPAAKVRAPVMEHMCMRAWQLGDGCSVPRLLPFGLACPVPPCFEGP